MPVFANCSSDASKRDVHRGTGGSFSHAVIDGAIRRGKEGEPMFYAASANFISESPSCRHLADRAAQPPMAGHVDRTNRLWAGWLSAPGARIMGSDGYVQAGTKT
jgi:hypothetical protein